jgi:hypothetical protein
MIRHFFDRFTWFWRAGRFMSGSSPSHDLVDGLKHNHIAGRKKLKVTNNCCELSCLEHGTEWKWRCGWRRRIGGARDDAYMARSSSSTRGRGCPLGEDESVAQAMMHL